jgi:hypothetical protein
LLRRETTTTAGTSCSPPTLRLGKELRKDRGRFGFGSVVGVCFSENSHGRFGKKHSVRLPDARAPLGGGGGRAGRPRADARAVVRAGGAAAGPRAAWAGAGDAASAKRSWAGGAASARWRGAGPPRLGWRGGSWAATRGPTRGRWRWAERVGKRGEEGDGVSRPKWARGGEVG